MDYAVVYSFCLRHRVRKFFERGRFCATTASVFYSTRRRSAAGRIACNAGRPCGGSSSCRSLAFSSSAAGAGGAMRGSASSIRSWNAFSGLIFVFVPLALGAAASGISRDDPAFSSSPSLWVAVFEALLVMALIDIRLGIIPDEINIFLGVIGVFLAIVSAGYFGAANHSFLGPYAAIFGWQGSVVLAQVIGAAVGGVFFAAAHRRHARQRHGDGRPQARDPARADLRLAGHHFCDGVCICDRRARGHLRHRCAERTA